MYIFKIKDIQEKKVHYDRYTKVFKSHLSYRLVSCIGWDKLKVYTRAISNGVLS